MLRRASVTDRTKWSARDDTLSLLIVVIVHPLSHQLFQVFDFRFNKSCHMSECSVSNKFTAMCCVLWILNTWYGSRNVTWCIDSHCTVWLTPQYTSYKNPWGQCTPGPWFNIEMSSYQYRKSHCGDKTVVRSSYLHNGISYTGEMSSLYWIGSQQISLLLSNMVCRTLTNISVREWHRHLWFTSRVWSFCTWHLDQWKDNSLAYISLATMCRPQVDGDNVLCVTRARMTHSTVGGISIKSPFPGLLWWRPSRW